MKKKKVFWRKMLRALLAPRRGQNVRMTSAGAGALVFAVMSGAGAYGLGSNALLITFSVLLSVLALGAVMSRLNLRGAGCRLDVGSPMRAGSEQWVNVEISNAKRSLGARALRVRVRSRSGGAERLWLANVERGGTARLPWRVTPGRRGVERLEVEGIGSLFPFGFFEKIIPANDGAMREVPVRPAAIEYRRLADFGAALRTRGARVPGPARDGSESVELRTLRGYHAGDLQRRIYWKASARTGRLMVREFVAEHEAGAALRVRTDAAVWTRAGQFEKMCSLAATLAEDLFAAGELAAVAIGDGRWRSVGSRADVERFLDALAVVVPATAPSKVNQADRKQVITFAPSGAREVVAYVDGKAAAAT